MKKLFLLITCLLLASCATTKTQLKPIQIQAEFPEPYDENGNAYITLENDNSVKMPLWYWLKITDYVIDVQTNIELYNSDIK